MPDFNDPQEGQVWFYSGGNWVCAGLVGVDSLTFTSDTSVDPAYSGVYSSGVPLNHIAHDGITGYPPTGDGPF